MAFILLGGERHRESKVSSTRTRHNEPGQHSNLDCSQPLYFLDANNGKPSASRAQAERKPSASERGARGDAWGRGAQFQFARGYNDLRKYRNRELSNSNPDHSIRSPTRPFDHCASHSSHFLSLTQLGSNNRRSFITGTYQFDNRNIFPFRKLSV